MQSVNRFSSLKIEIKDDAIFEQTLNLWERIITGGNDVYHKGQRLCAIGAYYQAIRVAHELISISPLHEKSLSAITASYHNLSDTFLYCHRANEMKTALTLAFNTICEAENIVRSLSEKASQNVPQMMRSVSITRKQRILFLKHYPQFLRDANCENAPSKSSWLLN